MKTHGYKLQYRWQGIPPVAPGMSAIPDPEFVGNLFLPHGDMNQTITLVQKIIIATIYVPSDRLFLVIGHVFNQFEGAMTGKIGVQRLF